MHVQVDVPPHVLEDEIGLRLVGPDDGWWQRPDMDPRATSGYRASVVARARFIEDLVTEEAGHGVAQYVILGAGLAMTFILPLELIDPEERPQHEEVYNRARAAGTPFLSFFSPSEMLALAQEAGFSKTRHVSTADLTQRYFTGRADGLQPASGEAFLVATT